MVISQEFAASLPRCFKWLNDKMFLLSIAEDEKIVIDGREVKSVDPFCYLGSLMTADSRCDREVKVRIG